MKFESYEKITICFITHFKHTHYGSGRANVPVATQRNFATG